MKSNMFGNKRFSEQIGKLDTEETFFMHGLNSVNNKNNTNSTQIDSGLEFDQTQFMSP